MSATTSRDYERFTRPFYNFAEADRLARVSSGTSKRWVKGYWYWDEPGEQRVARPPITSPEERQAVSFFDLIGVVAIREMRKARLSLPQVRRVVNYCQQELGVEYPLVTESFKTDGQQIFIEAGEGFLLDVLHHRGAQVWAEALEPFLKTIDYQQELARRWWPLGREMNVVVDPDYGFGLPVISGSGVRTEIIAERFRAGDGSGEIAEDFGIRVAEVEDALRYELAEAA